MNLASVSFGVFLLLSLTVYYMCPGKFRWIILLLSSIVFFVFSGNPLLIVWPIIAAIVSWAAACRIEKAMQSENEVLAKRWLWTGVISVLLILAAFKYLNFAVLNLNFVLRHIPGVNTLEYFKFAAPIGISFYSFQLIAYLADVYWERQKSIKNPLKVVLYTMFFPQMTSGPIMTYEEIGEQLFAANKVSYRNITFGLQRVLWGLFKKLVISARLGIITDTIYSNNYRGMYIWVAAGMYLLQLYTDFSGCMDMIIGAAECFGIKMPENFRTPFLSRNVQEFWQRWHITLGGFMKNYVMYPLLRTKPFSNLSKKLRKSGKKELSKKLPSYLAMLVVWLLIGLWHGGSWKYILGEGLWFYVCIVIGKETEEFWAKLMEKIKLSPDCFFVRLIDAVRVFILVSIGIMFFRLESLGMVIAKIKAGLSLFNPWIFTDGSLYRMGLSRNSFLVMLMSLLLLLIVALLQEKGSVRERIAGQNIIVRWIIYLSLIFSIIIFGVYGSGFNASDFIYGGF